MHVHQADYVHTQVSTIYLRVFHAQMGCTVERQQAERIFYNVQRGSIVRSLPLLLLVSRINVRQVLCADREQVKAIDFLVNAHNSSIALKVQCTISPLRY